jgi:uncharacterized membrane protein YpjA
MFLIPLLLGAMNVFGFLIGIFGSYIYQLEAANPLMWIFIPDCPLYVLLSTFFILGIRNPYFRAITAAGLMKYGLWTLFALLHYPNELLLHPVGYALFALHIGMALQVFLPSYRLEKKHIAAALAWFLLNDYVDYALGYHPVLPSPDAMPEMLAALFLTFASVAFVYFVSSRLAKSGLLARIREISLLNFTP